MYVSNERERGKKVRSVEGQGWRSVELTKLNAERNPFNGSY